MTRQSIRPKIRFEVFKRDGFTCQYCGRKTPDVVLEVDHIIPVAEGGGDEPENLVTACWDCNRGKGAAGLDERAPVVDIATQTELIREREEQIREYHEVKAEQFQRLDSQLDEVWHYWFGLFGREELPARATPSETTLRRYIDALGVHEVKEAMDIAHERFWYPNTRPVRYLYGVLKWKLAATEGRITACEICGERMALTTEEARQGTDGWYHTACKTEGNP